MNFFMMFGRNLSPVGLNPENKIFYSGIEKEFKKSAYYTFKKFRVIISITGVSLIMFLAA
jgi:hypothetical protein